MYPNNKVVIANFKNSDTDKTQEQKKSEEDKSDENKTDEKTDPQENNNNSQQSSTTTGPKSGSESKEDKVGIWWRISNIP